MARVEHAVLAAAILVAFVADLRVVAPIALGILVWWTVRRHTPRVESAIGITLLAAATIEFVFDNEVATWALTLAVAVLAGVIAARPRTTGRPAGANGAAGSTSRAR